MNQEIHYSPKTELIMPEYGRNVQQMVAHACTIADRAERTRCARTIIDIMGNLFPYLRDVEDFKHKLWDHLYIMSNYQLDIDYPFEVQKAQELPRPDKLPYDVQNIRYRHYGRWLQTLIAIAEAEPNEERRAALARLIANNMKRSYVAWNKDLADDTKIFDDLREMSHGKIDLANSGITLVAIHSNNNNNNKRKNGRNNQKNKQKSAK